MNFVSKNLNKSQSLVTKLKFITKDFKAQFQYPAHAPKVNRALVETLFKALVVPYFSQKNKEPNRLRLSSTVAIKLHRCR